MNKEKVYKVELIATTMAVVHANSEEEAMAVARSLVDSGDFDIAMVEVVSEGTV